MKIKVLVDNNASVKLKGEWGLSYYIEDEGKKILFDVGTSDLFIKNADELGIDLMDLDYIVFSHGHFDHTWGLPHLIRRYMEQGIEKDDRPIFVAHPLAFYPKYNVTDKENGSLIGVEEIKRHFNTKFTKIPLKLTENITYLGEIKRINNFEGQNILGKYYKDGKYYDDYMIDDTALVYEKNHEIIIITGCSHSGICNIIENALYYSQGNNIVDLIGGLHLINPESDIINKTLDYIKSKSIEKIHPCHCTDLKSKIELSSVANVCELSVGSILKY
ncbi:MBL fold metallo-hydrolase [Clostridiisalibacter paucivorans]|uniref:MBL fold metallo-hydrolase n=1 Tax=Clostridiisalibacter paucivorans TaxID=408753 RepID=UPI00047EF38B|nr:MBL fold metallo-hydrolase [Clostridiisalibacter paucivorans]